MRDEYQRRMVLSMYSSSEQHPVYSMEAAHYRETGLSVLREILRNVVN